MNDLYCLPLTYPSLLHMDKCYLVRCDFQSIVLAVSYGFKHERSFCPSAVDIPFPILDFYFIKHPEAFHLIRKLASLFNATFVDGRFVQLTIVASDFLFREVVS